MMSGLAGRSLDRQPPIAKFMYEGIPEENRMWKDHEGGSSGLYARQHPGADGVLMRTAVIVHGL
jgi:hypothetical protein